MSSKKVLLNFKKPAALLLGIASIALFVYSINIAGKFFSFTHNGKYSGEFTVKECRVKYSSLEDAATNCPNVEGSYFLIRLLPAIISSLVLGRIAIELATPKDD